jgi:hypothetical protein
MRRTLPTEEARARQERRTHLPLLLVQPRGHATVGLSRLNAKRVRSALDIRTALGSHGHRALWVTPGASALRLLLGALPGVTATGMPCCTRCSASSSRGRRTVRLLSIGELVEALNSAHRTDLFVGVAPARADNAVILYRGNLEPLVVPVTWFKPVPGGPRPDVCDVAVTDCGQTIRLGKYQASAAVILYEFDEDYRRRAKLRQRQVDRSLGGALRQVRLQKGLRQKDFSGLTAKEIARIERGEVKKPHQRTLAKIARRIGTRVEETSTY